VPNAAANPISESAFRREIDSDLMIAVMSNLPDKDCQCIQNEEDRIDLYQQWSDVLLRRDRRWKVAGFIAA